MSQVQMEALDFRYLLLEYYKKLNISETELAVLLMINHLRSQKNAFITPDLLSLKMNLSVEELDTLLVGFLDKKFIVYDMDANKNIKLSLKPLRKRLYEEFQVNLTRDLETLNDENKSEALKNIYQVFEAELNRSLSPVELSLIGDWVDAGWSDELIICALREALAKGRKTLKSVDKILLQWQAREDIEKTGGYTAISDTWNKDIDKTIEIAKAKWIEDDD